MTSDKMQEKGEYGELLFKQWLDNNKFAYLYVNQDPSSFPTLFKQDIKRPDYLVLLNSIGLLAVDVKNRRAKEKYDDFTLDKDKEILQTIAFERIFRIPFWYAFLDPNDESRWYWINALKVVEVGELKTNKDGGQFFAIPKKEFSIITTAKDMGKLFHQTMESYGNCLSDIQY